MRNRMIKTLLSTSILAAVILCSPANASFFSSNGSWTETFTLTNGTKVTHYPDHIVIGNGYFYGAGVCINGMCLQPDMTREEFVAELKRCRVYKGK